MLQIFECLKIFSHMQQVVLDNVLVDVCKQWLIGVGEKIFDPPNPPCSLLPTPADVSAVSRKARPI